MEVIPTPLHPKLPNAKDRTQVEVLSGMGASPEYIAHHLKITLEELNTHYSPQLSLGREEANLRIAKTFFDMAESGNYPSATLSWMKMRAGWSEAPASTTTEEDVDIDVAREKLQKLLNRGK